MAFDPTYPAYPIFAFLSFVLVLIPFPWHLQAWNSGTCLYMIWVAIGSLNFFINSIVWHANAIDWAPIWCDISSRLTVGLAVAIPATSLCINRRLYKIASVQTVSISRGEKRNAVLVDLAIGLGIPAVQMAVQFVVQGHRYDIWEDIGCLPTTFNTPPAYPLSLCWPLAIACVSAVYCILTLRAFMRRRAQFSQYLAANASLTVNRYFRLMSLASIELLFNIPINAYGLYLNITASPIHPWRGWADAHFDWYLIGQFPAVIWRSSTRTVVTFELSRWSVVLCGFLFFVFFGFADEARKHYRLAFIWLATRLGFSRFISSTKISHSGFKKPSFILPTSSKSTLPVFKTKESSFPPVKRFSSSVSSVTTSAGTSCPSPDTPRFAAIPMPPPYVPPTSFNAPNTRMNNTSQTPSLSSAHRDSCTTTYYVAL